MNDRIMYLILGIAMMIWLLIALGSYIYIVNS